MPQEETREQATQGAPEPQFGTYPFSFTRYRLFPDSKIVIAQPGSNKEPPGESAFWRA
jgi:hypothetical protein